MISYVLIDQNKLIESFLEMSHRSKQIHSITKDKLLAKNKASVSSADIIQHEYLLWLEKKGIVKRIN